MVVFLFHFFPKHITVKCSLCSPCNLNISIGKKSTVPFSTGLYTTVGASKINWWPNTFMNFLKISLLSIWSARVLCLKDPIVSQELQSVHYQDTSTWFLDLKHYKFRKEFSICAFEKNIYICFKMLYILWPIVYFTIFFYFSSYALDDSCRSVLEFTLSLLQGQHW